MEEITEACVKHKPIETIDLWARLDEKIFFQAQPFPHQILEDFFPLEYALRLSKSFPSFHDAQWFEYQNAIEKKWISSQKILFPQALRECVEILNSHDSARRISERLHIDDLEPDPLLHGGGLHATRQGGKLDLHLDYAIHPHSGLERRLNFLVYLSPDWQPSFGGELEFWDASVQKCIQRIAPRFNRAVVFETSDRSYHGHPEPLGGPADFVRRSLALYFLSPCRSKTTPRYKAQFVARPQDPPNPALDELRQKRAQVQTAAATYRQRNPLFIPGESPIPVCSYEPSSADRKALLEAAQDFAITSGKRVKKFEQAFAQSLQHTIPAVMTNSGSSANLLACATLFSPQMKVFGLRPLTRGDEILTLATGFPTTINPFLTYGCQIRLIDPDLETLNANLKDIQNQIHAKTRAIVLAHTLGNPFPVVELRQLCDQEGIYLIEDACDAYLSEVQDQNEWKKVGRFGELSSFSFYPAHHLATGEGGAVLTPHSHFRKIVASLRSWGRDCWCEPNQDNRCGRRFETDWEGLPFGYDHKYVFSEIGFNLKATDLQAALGLAQLPTQEAFRSRRRENFQKLLSGIYSSPKLREHFQTIKERMDHRANWFGFPLLCEDSLDRRKVIAYLNSRRVGTRMIFSGNFAKQPAYRHISFLGGEHLPRADRILESGFWIACHPQLTDEMISTMLAALEDSVGVAHK